jgi:hypothetical protein
MSREDPQASAERMQALLERWRQSLELHTRYLSLDDAHYWHVQPWPPHERPAAWIVQLARQKLSELARALAEHTARGELNFAVRLEQMAFLANLVGLQPAGRHLPLADPRNEEPGILADSAGTTGDPPRARQPRGHARPARAARTPRAAPARTTASRPARSAPARSLQPTAPEAPTAAPVAPVAPVAPLDAQAREVIEDAIRLTQWGRKWHELGELISRLPARPGVGETRRILRAHRARIEAEAASAGARE